MSVYAKEEIAKICARECADEKNAVRPGGRNGRPFWNRCAMQFLYVPAFDFTPVPGAREYRYEAACADGRTRAFAAGGPRELLTPIWGEIPEGTVTLRVTGILPDGTEYLAGARTFYRKAPFDGTAPGRARPYRESALLAYRYLMKQGFVRHWITHGTPDPDYDLNTYPSKMTGKLVCSLLRYADMCPEARDEAIAIARAAADHLIRLTPDDGSPLMGIPPTYDLSFCPDPEAHHILTGNWRAACAHAGTVMMIYPAQAGRAYIALERATGDRRYLDAALAIARYYREHAEEDGTWKLVVSEKTGGAVSENRLLPMECVAPFLTDVYQRTGDAAWKELADRSVGYVTENVLPLYDWEGQFEDSGLSQRYSNLSHYGAGALAEYLLAARPGDAEAQETAKELMRFVEDQFVVWKKPAPWNMHGYDTSVWHTPAGLEQYNWLMPIDASTAAIAGNYLAMYEAGLGGICLEKARALADQITVMQGEDGRIPTHWMNTEEADRNFWLNCMLTAADLLARMAEYE